MSINYRSDFFEYENLTPIRGEPDFESILKMKNEIKSNAQSVPSTLGGGNHGLLGLVLNPVEYTLVSNVPFVSEPYPGALTFLAGTTALQSKIQEDAYKKRLALYHACVGVGKSLLQQVVKAVEEDWLAPLRNATTNAIQGTVPDIIAYLFTTHGDISPESLIKREQRIKSMQYDPVSEPVDKVFMEVTHLVDYASAAGAPFTRPQTLNIAYVIRKNTRVFNNAIKEWNRLTRATPNHASWVNFKSHFRQAYKELHEVEELRAGDKQFHDTANLVSQIVDAVQESLQQVEEVPPETQSHPVLNALPNGAVANAVVNPTSSSSPEMQALLQQMKLMNSNFMNYQNNTPSSGRTGNSVGRGRGRSGRNGYSGRGCGRFTRSPRIMR